MTIDELARRTQTTTRTLRLYQTKGLLPPPRIIGRVGYYTDMHANRLVMIERLQSRGFSLAGIGELFKMWQEGKSLDELFGFEAKLTQPWHQEEPEFYTRAEAEARAPVLFEQPGLLEKTIKLGVIEQLSDGTFKVVSPTLVSFGEDLVSAGLSVDMVLEQLEELQEDARRMAGRFVKLFRSHMLPNMVKGGPMEWLPRLAEYSVKVRPALRAVVVAVFTRAMDEAVRGITQQSIQTEKAEAELAEIESEQEPAAPLEAAASDRG